MGQCCARESSNHEETINEFYNSFGIKNFTPKEYHDFTLQTLQSITDKQAYALIGERFIFGNSFSNNTYSDFWNTAINSDYIQFILIGLTFICKSTDLEELVSYLTGMILIRFGNKVTTDAKIAVNFIEKDLLKSILNAHVQFVSAMSVPYLKDYSAEKIIFEQVMNTSFSLKVREELVEEILKNETERKVNINDFVEKNYKFLNDDAKIRERLIALSRPNRNLI